LVPGGGALIPNRATVPELPDTMRARPYLRLATRRIAERSAASEKYRTPMHSSCEK
jgi:hypothetical protein